MRIAYLSESAIPSREANSVHVMKMCQAFAKQGHEVTLYSRVGMEPVSDWHAHYGVRPSFEIIRCRQPRWRRAGKVVYGWRVARAMAQRPRSDLLYGRQAFGLAASARFGIPIVLEVHGLASGLPLRLTHRWLMRQPNFVRLVVITEALKRDVLSLFPWLAPEQVRVAPDGADLPDPGPVAMDLAFRGRPDCLQVGYLGQLFRGKGMEVIVPLAQRLPDVDFHVAGGTPEDLAFWKQKCSSISNLKLHGYIAPGQTEAFRGAMDVLLAPTQPWVGKAGGGGDLARWISPIKIFEYMASRKPVVASDLPVLREVLSDGVNALLVQPDDPEAWVGAIQRLGKDDRLREALADRAYQDLATHYTWEQRAASVLQGIQERA